MNKLINALVILVLVFSIFLGVNASSVNPNGQCGEGPTGSLLFKDYMEDVGTSQTPTNPYFVNVCKYYNVGGLTLTASEFCYLPEVINGWYIIYSAHINQAGTYVCKIDTNVEGHWSQNNEMSFRSHN